MLPQTREASKLHREGRTKDGMFWLEELPPKEVGKREKMRIYLQMLNRLYEWSKLREMLFLNSFWQL